MVSFPFQRDHCPGQESPVGNELYSLPFHINDFWNCIGEMPCFKFLIVNLISQCFWLTIATRASFRFKRFASGIRHRGKANVPVLLSMGWEYSTYQRFVVAILNSSIVSIADLVISV